MKKFVIVAVCMFAFACHRDSASGTSDVPPNQDPPVPTKHHYTPSGLVNWQGPNVVPDLNSNNDTDMNNDADLGTMPDASAQPDASVVPDASVLPDAAIGDGTCAGDSVKLDTGLVGVLGATVAVDGVSLTITKWYEKTDESTDYYGFDFAATGSYTSISYVVKAGTELFNGNSSTWLNEYGTCGPSVHGISHIIFCVVK